MVFLWIVGLTKWPLSALNVEPVVELLNALSLQKTIYVQTMKIDQFGAEWMKATMFSSKIK